MLDVWLLLRSKLSTYLLHVYEQCTEYVQGWALHWLKIKYCFKVGIYASTQTMNQSRPKAVANLLNVNQGLSRCSMEVCMKCRRVDKGKMDIFSEIVMISLEPESRAFRK